MNTINKIYGITQENLESPPTNLIDKENNFIEISVIRISSKTWKRGGRNRNKIGN